MGRMPTPNRLALVDTLRDGSVSFAPPSTHGPLDHSVAGADAPRSVRAAIAVGPGRAAIEAPALIRGASQGVVSGFPIQPGKIQRPLLREETLARHRLLDWLDVKIHNRVMFVIAEAGYGKTTLLADFSRRTHLRTLWYRMDAEDRSWGSFLSYLIAAGREYEPEFAQRTAAMLRESEPGGPTRDEVLDVFLRELPAISEEGAAFILDDFHVADDVPDIRFIARELVARAPERLTVVFSSRRVPAIPVGRLRSHGELAELRTTDLRFSEAETGELFRETYRHPLEGDVLADLTRRTEGWAASLHLVRAAVRERSTVETRSFIRALSGATSDLHDYLAEEVVGELPEEHQDFLMRTSILQSVEPEAAEVASGMDTTTVHELITESERLGLLSRRQEWTKPGFGFHPLVREFLEARLRRSMREEAVAELHTTVARWAESRDWRIACFHHAAAGNVDELLRVLDGSIESVVGAGDIALASGYLDKNEPTKTTPGFEVIRSRAAARRMDVPAAIRHANLAMSLDPTSDSALGNQLAVYFLAGNLVEASALASQIATTARSELLRDIGAASWLVLEASLEANLDDGATLLHRLAEKSREHGHLHYEGVSLLNAAQIHRAQGKAELAESEARDAADALRQSSSGSEVLSARLAQAWASAHLGNVTQARNYLSQAAETCPNASRPEWLLEATTIEVWYGDEDVAASCLDELVSRDLNPALRAAAELAAAQLALRRGDLDGADREMPRETPAVPRQEPGHLSRYLALQAYVLSVRGAPEARQQLLRAAAIADRQASTFWANYCRVVLALGPSDAAAGSVADLRRFDPVYLSLVAEVVIGSLHKLDADSLELVVAEAERRPERWRNSVRRAATDKSSASNLHAARLLDVIGVAADVPILRAIGRAAKHSPADASLGRRLARRLAPRVIVEDQGRVEILIGSSRMPGTDLRRKVLALLCYLLTRERFSATRDEVVDALWPDTAPEVAVNSLNQTVYFLRRVFEPGYKEDISAGYVQHDSDVLWLDQDLISSRSQACRELMGDLPDDPSPTDALRLSELYRNRFALDFSYEDWAVPYRDSQHVGYLRVIEAAVSRDLETGHWARGIVLARRALEIEPEQESLELCLLRLYRATGAHSAAAEQYAHYAAYLRDELGVEPPALSTL
jgi:ATP/maltotriose-dependent transcriptional regulator MalT/DNA-binding SARP family transcriptional activator